MFKRLFRRKPGGSFVGNFIRRAVFSYSHGLVGTSDGLPADETTGQVGIISQQFNK